MYLIEKKSLNKYHFPSSRLQTIKGKIGESVRAFVNYRSGGPVFEVNITVTDNGNLDELFWFDDKINYNEFAKFK